MIPIFFVGYCSLKQFFPPCPLPCPGNQGTAVTEPPILCREIDYHYNTLTGERLEKGLYNDRSEGLMS